MEQKIGTVSVEKIKDGVWIVKSGCVSFQLSEDGMYELMQSIGKEIKMVAVDYDELKGMTTKIDHILHDDLIVPKHSIPIRKTTNNNCMGYTGDSLTTEQKLNLNKELKHS